MPSLVPRHVMFVLEQTGSLVFCRVAAVDKDMDTELTCTCKVFFLRTRGRGGCFAAFACFVVSVDEPRTAEFSVFPLV